MLRAQDEDSNRRPTATSRPPWSVSTTLAAQATPASSRRGTRRPQGRTSAGASTPPAILSTPASMPKATPAGSRALASSSIAPPTVSSPRR
jgi:hypothetical protein